MSKERFNLVTGYCKTRKVVTSVGLFELWTCLECYYSADE